MPKITRFALVSVLFAAACADDEFQQPPAIDARIDAAEIDGPVIDAPIDAVAIDADPDAVPIDAPIDAMSSVMTVTCPVTPDLEINAATGAYVYTPSSATINANGIIRFTPGGSHNMISGTQASPNGLFATPTGQITCLRFTAAGTFPFFCSVHGFSGSITVN